MKTGFLSSLGVLALASGLVLGQQPTLPTPAVIVPGPAPAGEPAPVPCTVTETSQLSLFEDGDKVLDDAAHHFYGRAEYLLWWFRQSPVPAPLLTTTTDATTLPLAALGPASTSVLLGGSGIDTGARHGARFTGGFWLDEQHTVALEGSYFFLGSQTTTRTVSSSGQPGSPVLAVPFFDEDALAENSFPLASPGIAAGAASLSLTSRLQGAEVQGAILTSTHDAFRLDVLAGFRYLDLIENLTYATTTTGLADPTTDLVLNTVDHLGTHNQFYGFQIGLRADYERNGLVLGATAKLAMGDMHEAEKLNGFASTNFFNAPAGGPFTGVPLQTIPGAGTFIQSSNAGRPFRDVIAAAPEFNLKAGYQLNRHFRVTLGYDFLYLSDVLRPGNQLDRGLNFSQTLQSVVAGNTPAMGTRPMIGFAGSGFWAQGLTFGCEWRY